MTTLILPGFSLKNKAWAEDIKQKMAPNLTSRVIFWPHWKTGRTEKNWIEKEARKILTKGAKINIIAKSVGTVIAMATLRLEANLIHKIILCGIPMNDFEKGDEKYYEILKNFDSERVFCIQNAKDNHGSYRRVKKFIQSINPEITVIYKPRSDHLYPYPKDFIKFLK